MYLHNNYKFYSQNSKAIDGGIWFNTEKWNYTQNYTFQHKRRITIWRSCRIL